MLMKVKVCGMRDARNVKEISEASPDFIGFIFYGGSKRFVGNEPSMHIFLNVPERTEKVAVFVNETPERVIGIAEKYRIGTIQLHGNETPHFCSMMKSSGLAVIKAFGIDTGFNFDLLVPYLDACDYFLFDMKSESLGGSGMKFNWSLLERYVYNKKFFLSGGIGSNDADLIRSFSHSQMFCIDINSRFEISPGLKDPVIVRDFINKVKNFQR
jgi:phosphoribosylanthranilate isomerase